MLKQGNDKITNILYKTFLTVIILLTIWVWVVSPTQPHFSKLDNNDVWFGDDWHYKEGNATAASYLDHYLKLDVTDGHVVISKTIDFTPDDDEYMCFRAASQDVIVYVNGEIWYEKHYVEQYRSYSKTMYLLHQFTVDGIKAGDVITIDMTSVSDHTSLHFISLGDRFAITRYILWRSRYSFFVCLIAIIMVIMNIVTSHSPIFMDNKGRDIVSLKWLTSFLGCAIVYISTSSGAMELFIDKNSVVSWLSNVSFLMLPIPFIMFTRDAIFPNHVRYSILALIDFLATIWCIIAYMVFKVSFSDYYIVVHVIVSVGMIMCAVSFTQEKIVPSLDVAIGYGSVIMGAILSIICYWKAIVYPPATAFGVGLVIFCVCMFCWIVRKRHKLNKLQEKARRDAMERDKIEAERANQQKSRFLSHMSHEIRTPLNAMLGMSELIMNEKDISKTKEYSINIQSAGRTLLALVNDVLDFSKIESGKLELSESEYSLSSLLNDVVLITQKRASDKGIEYKLNIDGTLPDMLKGDEVRIKQVMVNIITNAIKYTKEGFVELSVYTNSENSFLDEDNLNLIIKVSDTGLGIKKEDMPKLFTEFERLDRDKNTNIEGSGLGLSITYQLVKIMKGDITVESEYGKGSTFIVKLPQDVILSVPIGDYKKRFEILTNEKEKKEIETLESVKFPGKHVYVVDDNEMNLEVIASILELMEITVDRGGSGEEAKHHLDAKSYDLILTDDMMPDICGTELMRYIHNNPDSKSHNTPIVVLTANAVTGARKEYIDKGFDDYMTKPIDIEVLQKILINYLK